MKIRLKHIPYILLYVLAILLITMMTTEGGFTFSKLNDADFWGTFLVISAANWIVLISSANLRINKMKEEKKKLIKAGDTDDSYVAKYTSLAYLLDNLGTTFSSWLIKDNKRKKKEAYTRKIKKKMIFWGKFASEKSKTLWIQSNNVRADKSITAQAEKNWYCKKMVKLTALIDDDRLEEYIDAINVKYSHVRESFIRVGTESVGKGDDEYVLNGAFKKFIDLLPRFLLNLGYVLIITTFNPGPISSVGIAEILDGVLRLGVLVMNAIAGREYAPMFFREHIEHQMQLRINIIARSKGGR